MPLGLPCRDRSFCGWRGVPARSSRRRPACWRVTRRPVRIVRVLAVISVLGRGFEVEESAGSASDSTVEVDRFKIRVTTKTTMVQHTTSVECRRTTGRGARRSIRSFRTNTASLGLVDSRRRRPVRVGGAVESRTNSSVPGDRLTSDPSFPRGPVLLGECSSCLDSPCSPRSSRLRQELGQANTSQRRRRSMLFFAREAFDTERARFVRRRFPLLVPAARPRVGQIPGRVLPFHPSVSLADPPYRGCRPRWRVSRVAAAPFRTRLPHVVQVARGGSRRGFRFLKLPAPLGCEPRADCHDVSSRYFFECSALETSPRRS